MAENKKMGFLQSKGYAHLSNGTATATSLKPNERAAFNEDDPQHKLERSLAEAGDPNALFEYVEVDLAQEAKAEDEKQEMLAKASEIAADVRNEEAQAAAEKVAENQQLQAQAREEGQPAVNAGTDFPPQDVEAQKLAEQSGAGQRASTQADVVEETKTTSRKRSSKG